jgi:hypothetical protein
VKKTAPPPSSNSEVLNEHKLWLESHRDTLPDHIVLALEQYGKLAEALAGSRYKLTQMLHELRRALGISPQTERKKSNDRVSSVSGKGGPRPRTLREKLQADLERKDALATWHLKQARNHSYTWGR